MVRSALERGTDMLVKPSALCASDASWGKRWSFQKVTAGVQEEWIV